MSREEIYNEIREAFGEVPSFLQRLPDSTLELEWGLLKRVQLEEGLIPQKYRELIGLGLAAGRGCPYCAYFHTEMAKLHGATEGEIEEAVHFAKSSVGWSTYVHGMQIPLDEFKKEIDKAVDYVLKRQEKMRKAA
jgi:AhpD family alkylhydroperoxidase